MFVICIQNKQNAKIDEIEMKFVDALYYTLITTKVYEATYPEVICCKRKKREREK
jgi:hypothetical protein